MTSCPECSSADLESFGIERGERFGDDHTVLISKFGCKSCGCEFNEIRLTQWRAEILEHGNLARLIMTEPEP